MSVVQPTTRRSTCWNCRGSWPKKRSLGRGLLPGTAQSVWPWAKLFGKWFALLHMIFPSDRDRQALSKRDIQLQVHPICVRRAETGCGEGLFDIISNEKM